MSNNAKPLRRIQIVDATQNYENEPQSDEFIQNEGPDNSSKSSAIIEEDAKDVDDSSFDRDQDVYIGESDNQPDVETSAESQDNYHGNYEAESFNAALETENISVKAESIAIPKSVNQRSPYAPPKQKILTHNISEYEFQGDYTETDHSSIGDQRAKQRKYPGSNTLPKLPVQQYSKIQINVQDACYPVLKFVAKKALHWKLVYAADPLEWDVYWTDYNVSPEFLARMLPFQRVNHFPGMTHIAYKDEMAKNLGILRQKFPQQYNFYPRTWILPEDGGDFKRWAVDHPGSIFMVKPEQSSQGKGIYMINDYQIIDRTKKYLIQHYLADPYTIDGLKFDFRFYVLLTGCDPLRIYFYEEGMVRFATTKYQTPQPQNLEDTFMHLTNYAINKTSANFLQNTSLEAMHKGHKRTVTAVYYWLEKHGVDIQKLQKKIDDIIVKTIIAGQPQLSHIYNRCQSLNYANNMCFEILGFDIILDSSAEPLLLEINHRPSFATDTPLDIYIKKNLLEDTLRLINMNLQVKKQEIESYRQLYYQKIMTGKKLQLSEEAAREARLQAQAIRDDWDIKNSGAFLAHARLMFNKSIIQPTVLSSRTLTKQGSMPQAKGMQRDSSMPNAGTEARNNNFNKANNEWDTRPYNDAYLRKFYLQNGQYLYNKKPAYLQNDNVYSSCQFQKNEDAAQRKLQNYQKKQGFQGNNQNNVSYPLRPAKYMDERALPPWTKDPLFQQQQADAGSNKGNGSQQGQLPSISQKQVTSQDQANWSGRDNRYKYYNQRGAVPTGESKAKLNGPLSGMNGKESQIKQDVNNDPQIGYKQNANLGREKGSRYSINDSIYSSIRKYAEKAKNHNDHKRYKKMQEIIRVYDLDFRALQPVAPSQTKDKAMWKTRNIANADRSVRGTEQGNNMRQDIQRYNSNQAIEEDYVYDGVDPNISDDSRYSRPLVTNSFA